MARILGGVPGDFGSLPGSASRVQRLIFRELWLEPTPSPACGRCRPGGRATHILSNQKSTETQGKLLAAISNAVVKVHADRIGRGPTKARTYIDNRVVICLLENALTRAERTLLDGGEAEHVRDLRRGLRDSMLDELVGEIEKLTGLKVRATIGGTQVDPDISSFVFVLDDDVPWPQANGQGRA